MGGIPALVCDIMVLLEPSFLHLNLLGCESLVLWRTRHGVTILGTMDIHGDGAIRGITADGMILGTGILGTTAVGTADGMEVGTADGTTHGTTAAGVTVTIITITTMTFSGQAADESTHHACPQQAPAGEAASDQHREARV